jgi:4-amino-4-deoxy-L-arabinose transferase-like glycosyltransferase
MYGAMAVAAAGLFAVAARGDLWLDEIWSLDFARDAHSAWDVFTHIHHDNNHPLNTLYLYWLKGNHSSIEYRLLSVLSGVGSVLLVGQIAQRQWGRAEARLAMPFLAICYPLLLYFSEARGYALAVFCALLAYSFWRKWLEENRMATALAFWLASAAGLLAHASFVIASIAFVFGHVIERFEATGRPGDAIASVAKLHAVPLAVAGAWYFYFLRTMTIGGGDPSSGFEVVGTACSYLVGLPDTPLYRLLAIVALLAFVVLEALSLRRARDGQWAFLLGITILAPAVALAASASDNLYFRYFLISFPFVVLFFAHAVCVAWHSWPRKWRWLALAALLVGAAGHLSRDVSLLRNGRGQYSEALSFILVHSEPGRVVIASDHDFRNSTVIEFFAPRLPDGGRLVYVDQEQWLEAKPEWLLLHSQDLHYRPMPAFAVRGVGEYTLLRIFPYSGVSGWTWYLYRRTGSVLAGANVP